MTQQGGRLHKVLCDVVAFANTRGGTVYVGLSATRKTPPRGVENAAEIAPLFKKDIDRHITPTLDAKVDVVQTMGAPIVRVTVPNGPDKPYALDQTRIFIRAEAETNEAVRDEIVQLVLAGREVAAPVVAAPVAAPPILTPQPAVIETVLVPTGEPEIELPVEAALPLEGAEGYVGVNENGLQPPAIGVEIVSMEERKGSTVLQYPRPA